MINGNERTSKYHNYTMIYFTFTPKSKCSQVITHPEDVDHILLGDGAGAE